MIDISEFASKQIKEMLTQDVDNLFLRVGVSLMEGAAACPTI